MDSDGIQDYWVIEVSGKQLWVHRNPVNGKYQSITTLTSGELSPLAMPEVDIQLNRLLLR